MAPTTPELLLLLKQLGVKQIQLPTNYGLVVHSQYDCYIIIIIIRKDKFILP